MATAKSDTLRVTDVTLKKALHVTCGECAREGIIPSYRLHARYKSLALVSSLVQKFRCSACKKVSDKTTWTVIDDPNYKPLADDPKYVGHSTSQRYY